MKTAMMMVIVMFAARVARADTTVNVTPSNQHGWTLNVFDSSGNVATGNVLDTPYNGGTAQLVSGPATPPGGAGAVHLATAAGGGDGAAAVATENFDGTKLSAITSLGYATYDVTNNGQQFPYMGISVDLGGLNGTGPDAGLDTIFFEPPFQTFNANGDHTIPDQGATALNTWQPWNVLEGAIWDNDGLYSPGSGTMGTLADIIASYPDATIENGGFPDLGGIAMQVGFASGSDNFDGYVANFDIGVNGVQTDVEFGPNTSSTPLPATVWEGSALFLLAGGISLARRARTA